VLKWVQEGEEVEVTRRSRVVARIVPCPDAGAPVRHPDFLDRARRIWGERPAGEALSDLVRTDRRERA
jgi:antitoxin (DNA-binding transcriptional repressor) of toxin-antitoxin stability system